MEITDISTEAVTLEDVTAAAEKLKETDANVIREWLESLLPGILGFAVQVLLAVVVYFIGTKIIKLVRKILKRWLDKADADVGAKQFLDALVKYILYFVLVVIILTFFGVTTASVIAVVGSAGVTIGLALQGSLSNFAGGVLILLLKPFKVGDYIKEDTHGNEGTVAEISIFYTKLLTADHKTIIIPNGTLANSSLTNATYSESRRVDLEVGIAYEADLKLAKKVMYELAEAESCRLPQEAIQVFVSELGSSEVKIGMRIWVKNEDYWDTKWRLTENIKLAFDEKGIEIPYQKIDVQMRE
ncbi:MAG: mechanosensitive ion channel [Lachnospiraceae bacterium]|nr:mechanosensitive ion channel [Lachnospiraceae bacterium]